MPICLASLNRQTGPCVDFEVILAGPRFLNDVSIQKYSFPIHRIVCDENHPGIRRNLGAKSAKSDVLCFIDDDVCLPDLWLKKVVEILGRNRSFIISGPSRDRRKDFKYKLANAIQENFLTEGLLAHRELGSKRIAADHHNIHSCNMAMGREVFEKVGGFNVTADYFMDDVEFGYIARRLGYDMYLYRELEVQHDLRPAPVKYLVYKFLTRFHIGKNFPLFPECYSGVFQIWFILLSYAIFVPVVYLIFKIPHTLFLALVFIAIAYFVLLVVSSLKRVREPLLFLCVIPGVFLTHLFSYLGFTLGLLAGLLNYFGQSKVLKNKEIRYKAFA